MPYDQPGTTEQSAGVVIKNEVRIHTCPHCNKKLEIEKGELIVSDDNGTGESSPD